MTPPEPTSRFVLEAPTGARVSLATANRDTVVEVLRILHLPR